MRLLVFQHVEAVPVLAVLEPRRGAVHAPPAALERLDAHDVVAGVLLGGGVAAAAHAQQVAQLRALGRVRVRRGGERERLRAAGGGRRCCCGARGAGGAGGLLLLLRGASAGAGQAGAGGCYQ